MPSLQQDPALALLAALPVDAVRVLVCGCGVRGCGVWWRVG
ncbi:hypothetical protein [Saccharopolyspora spinosa]